MANQLGTARVNGAATAQVEELYMLRYSGDKEAADVIGTLSDASADWYSCLSLRGTVNVGQDASSLEKIQVDQFDAPIGVTVEPGDFNFECFMPSFEKEDLEAWLGSDVTVLTAAADGVDGYGLDLKGKIYTMSVLVKAKIGPAPYMLFSRVQVSVTFSQEDKTFGLRVAGQVMAPSYATNKPLYLIKALPGTIVPTSITIPSTKSMKVGDVVALTPTFAPANANKSVVWTSSDNSKATVDAQGHVTGVAAGTATIKCTSLLDSSKSGSCSITVSAQ